MTGGTDMVRTDSTHGYWRTHSTEHLGEQLARRAFGR